MTKFDQVLQVNHLQADLAAVNGLQFGISNLIGGQAGLALAVFLTEDGFGARNGLGWWFVGAGWGWFIDPTPQLSEEFTRIGAGPSFSAMPAKGAEGQLDLLTVVIHELGHVLGLNDSPRVGDIMGPLDLRKPVTTLGVDEVQALRDIRESAAEIRRQALSKALTHLRV